MTVQPIATRTILRELVLAIGLVLVSIIALASFSGFMNLALNPRVMTATQQQRGQGADIHRQLGTTFFPNLFDFKKELDSKGQQIAMQKSEEISKLPRGDVTAIDIDAGEILPVHNADLREMIWAAMRSRPGARLVFRRISNGHVGRY